MSIFFVIKDTFETKFLFLSKFREKMKKILILLLAVTLVAFSCKKSDEKNQQTVNDTTVTQKQDSISVVENNKDTLTTSDTTTEDETTELGKEYTSKYICPMHCKGSGSDKPGTCPVCGMEYIENPDYQGK